MLEEILDKIEKILACGFILPYKDIERIYGNTVSKNGGFNLNGNDYISVSLHKSNPQKIDILLKDDIPDCEDAFQSFILQEPSIVLDSKVENELNFLKCGGIYLERFITEPISLKYMCAISLYTNGLLAPFFNDIPESEYYKYINDSSFRVIPIEFLDRIRNLLQKYGYSVPLVDVLSGNQYVENEVYRSYVRTLKK